MQSSRRRILYGGASLLGLAALVKAGAPIAGSIFNEASAGRFLHGGIIQKPDGFDRHNYYPSAYFLNREAFRIDVQNLKSLSIATNAAPHVVETHPIDRRFSVVGTQRSDTIALIDWKSGKEVASRKLLNKTFYYGHSVFSKSGDKILSSVVQPAKARAIIEVLDFPSFKVLDEIEIERGIVHEIALLANNKFVFGLTPFYSLEQKPVFGFFDLGTRRAEYIEIPFAGKKAVFSHLQINRNQILGEIFEDLPTESLRLPAAQSHVTRLLSLDLNTHTVTEIRDPGLKNAIQEVSTQALSLAVDETEDTLWVSFPDLAKIQVWNLKDSGLLETLTFPMENAPRGVVLDAETGRMLVSTEKSVMVFDSRSRMPITNLALPTSGYCAHLRFTLA